MNPRVGENRESQFGGRMQIIRYENSSNVSVMFCDENHAIVHTTYRNFLSGHVKNPYVPSVAGVGFIGQGTHKSKNGKRHTPSYAAWKSMLQRCYSETFKDLYPAYYGICTVCEEWYNFQNFADWFDDNYYPMEGHLHVDKDILTPNNKVYSPQNCLLVPQRLNMLFDGKEKRGAEYAKHIRNVALEYKSNVPEKVFAALMDRASRVEQLS